MIRMKRKYRAVILLSFILFLIYYCSIYLPVNFFHSQDDLNPKEDEDLQNAIVNVIIQFSELENEEQIRRFKENLTDESQSQGRNFKEKDLLNFIFPHSQNVYTHERCSKISYSNSHDLPTLSVVVIFQLGEHPKNLFKMLTSLLLNTPQHLLKEIILVDDASKNYKFSRLMEGLPKVIYISLQEHLGAVGSRLIGSNIASGETILFSDPNLVFDEGWALPLLETIRKNPRAVACPILYRGTQRLSLRNFKGGFSWNITLKWIPYNHYDQEVFAKDPTAPIRSPAVPGNVYAMSKQHYFTLGEYDPAIDLISVQNIAFSIKTWQCGGEILIVPCCQILYQIPESKRKMSTNIGIVRPKKDFDEYDTENLFHRLRNAKRVAEIWMDEFSHYFYETEPRSVSLPYGKVEERKKLRQTAQCHTFSWYLLHVYTELAAPMPIIVAQGQVYNNQKCLTVPDVRNPKFINAPVDLRSCKRHGRSNWDFSEDGWLSHEKFCLSASREPDDSRVFVAVCEPGPLQRWWRDGKSLVHAFSGLCVDAQSLEGVLLRVCQIGSYSQQWTFTTELNPKYFKPKKTDLYYKNEYEDLTTNLTNN